MSEYYSIKMGGKYLQGIEPNATYCPMSKAPTMGRRHDVSEFKTIWSDKPVGFERITACNYIRTLLEEFRWECRKQEPFDVFPCGDCWKVEKNDAAD